MIDYTYNVREYDIYIDMEIWSFNGERVEKIALKQKEEFENWYDRYDTKKIWNRMKIERVREKIIDKKYLRMEELYQN
jgi:hypothetical protein